jgi:DNA-binding NarL/FixJ family response regulator
MTRLVIVDDQTTFRHSLNQLLTLAGLKVVAEAGDIPTAVELVRNLRPDLAIVDIFLPGISGLEGVASLKAAAPDMRIILVSAHGEQAQLLQAAALEAGAEAFYAKEDLDLELVRNWCEP